MTKSLVSGPQARRIVFCAGWLAAGLGAALPAVAQNELEPLTNILDRPGSAGLGALMQVSPSPYRDAGNRYDLLPIYLYEGERLFLHTNRVGLKLRGGKADASGAPADHRIDLFVEQRLEGFPSDKLPASLSGMANRDSGIDLGLAYRFHQPWGNIDAEFVHDISGTSKGSEARLAYSYDWHSGRLTLRPGILVTRRDARLNNYYYGVQASEAAVGRPAYSASSGTNATLGLYGTYDLTQRWRLLAGVSATRLGHTVENSPIVGRKVVPAVYLGAAYSFGGHKRERTQDNSPTYFKVLYGKSTEDGCHLAKIITAQCLSTAKVNSTSISAIQVGKPFIQQFKGWPLDFVGYVGVTQHNERGLQANGLQLDVFMKAVYSGFPWSDRVKTRLGLGVGLSAAQRAPWIEATSQAAAGRPASRLLNYLDPTLDVSVGDLIGVRSLKETYIGLGVSHRSGIFGQSRLLGNVNGGSNYIYTYLETAL